MGTIADKLIYLNGTKQALKEAINNIGGDITSETTFREYAQELQDIYDNIPKTTDTGTNLSLNTIKGKMNIIPKGDTSQTTYNGYNLLNLTLNYIKNENTSGTWNNNVYTISGLTITINEDMSIKANGTTTAQVTLIINGGTMPYATGTYYLSGAINGSNELYDVRIFNYDNKSGVAQCFTGTRQVNIVNNSQSFNMAVVIRNGVTCNNTMFYPMLSTTNTSNYEPYVGGTASPNPTYPQNIEVVTGTQEVKVSGNEFAEIETQTLNDMKITKTDNGYILNGTASANTSFRATITNATNTNKTICAKCDTTITNANVQIKTRNSSASQLRSISLGNANTWVVSSGTFEDYYCDIYVKSGTTLSNVLVQPMLLGGTFTTSNLGKYQPYNEEQTQIVSLGDIELCKIGNYQDYLYKSNGKWYKKEYIKNITLDNTQGFVFPNGSFNVRVNSTYINNAYSSSNQQIAPVLCNRAVGNTFDIVHTQNKMGIAVSLDGYIRLKFDNGDGSQTTWTQETVNNYLSANETIIYYVLKTPNDIEITNTTLIEQLDNLEKLKSYNGTTNISASGNLPVVLGVSALKGE